MATATISNFSAHFPCHSAYTSISVDMSDLGSCVGYDTSYGNHFGQGIPITIPSDAASNVTSITITITFYPRGNLNYGAPRYMHACVKGTKWDTRDGNAYYSNINGSSQASFEIPYGTTSTKTNTVTISGLSLAPGSTYYIYLHNNGARVGQIYHITNVVATCTYEEGGRVKIYTSNGWVPAIPWVYTSSGWVKAKPWVYTSSGWQRAK